MLSIGLRTAGADHAKLRELLLVTSRTCELLRFVNEHIIAEYQTERFGRIGQVSALSLSEDLHHPPTMDLTASQVRESGAGAPKFKCGETG